MTLKNPKSTKNNWVRIASLLGGLFVCVLLVFVIVQFRSTWQGPTISVAYPAPGQTIRNPILIVSGKTRNIAQLTLFGTPIPIQLKSNTFVAEIALPKGASTIALDGYTRSGRHTRTLLPVYYIPPVPGEPLSPTLEALYQYAPIETPFRPTSDILESIERSEQ